MNLLIVIVLMVEFVKCGQRNCKTCPSLHPTPHYKSNVTEKSFKAIYDFGEDEPHIISCKSTNVIYLLECTVCCSHVLRVIFV